MNGYDLMSKHSLTPKTMCNGMLNLQFNMLNHCRGLLNWEKSELEERCVEQIQHVESLAHRDAWRARICQNRRVHYTRRQGAWANSDAEREERNG
ncbi:hypothetical protein MtrunA17_Chr8g0353711 [Medicago truncatula]|uniref:Uncharacterized protein n=1 Tax=Medicago truncatula TaxID=3880 RepID=G7LHK3_MEDTR|nr:hypothetical protein MTR_8g040460 [Medicago truncatula]RHN40338.1 hypothetical protein MtrunA17_Chr8g0353711 [Medicago truncatula]